MLRGRRAGLLRGIIRERAWHLGLGGVRFLPTTHLDGLALTRPLLLSLLDRHLLRLQGFLPLLFGHPSLGLLCAQDPVDVVPASLQVEEIELQEGLEEEISLLARSVQEQLAARL